jgi:HK97 family phage prohead protease
MEHEKRILAQESADVRVAGGSIEGYAAVFGVRSEPLGGFVEVIEPGATIEFEDVRATFNHSPNQLLGRVKSGTLQLTVDDVGVRYRIKVPDTQAGRDVRELIKRGDVDGSSFMFDKVEDDWTRINDGGTLRTLKHIKVYELGPAAFPAYPDTTAAARGLEQFAARSMTTTQKRRSDDRPILAQRQREQEIAELCKGPEPDGETLS